MAAFVVDSGNGLQPLWRLAYAPKEWKPIENINCAIAKKLGSDSCHNIDRLLRVPGTINWPDATKRARGRAPVLARLAHDGGPEAIYTPDQLARVFPPIPGADKESKTSGEDIGEVELLTPDDLGLSSLSPLRSVIEHPTGHDRSRDGLRAAGDLLRAGFTKLQVARCSNRRNAAQEDPLKAACGPPIPTARQRRDDAIVNARNSNQATTRRNTDIGNKMGTRGIPGITSALLFGGSVRKLRRCSCSPPACARRPFPPSKLLPSMEPKLRRRPNELRTAMAISLGLRVILMSFALIAASFLNKG